jgi:RHS repeat-associated protein
MPVSGVGSGITTIHASANGGTASASVQVNAPPTISITGPIQGATFTAPASVPIVVSAADTDGSVRRVEVLANGSAITTLTAAPFSFVWTGVPAGNYILTAKIFDNNDAQTVSTPVSISVTAHTAALYFIHVDHLNTPRLVADSVGTPVWQWDQTEPFGDNPADGSSIEFPLRFAGQYFDKETNLAYNFYRDFDSSRGRYLQSDPIGLVGGTNTYAFVDSRPLVANDFFGLSPTCGTGNIGARITPNMYFTPCCGDHDDCYDDCKNLPSKDTCDREFNNCTLRQCVNRWIAVKFACEYFAVVYATSMRGDTANRAFDNARKACTSCRP